MIRLESLFNLNQSTRTHLTSLEMGKTSPETLAQSQGEPIKRTDDKAFDKLLEDCKGYPEVFNLVKKGVKKVLNRWRVGLMLILDDLPLHIGAYHVVGSNSIILNRRLLEIVHQHSSSRKEVNSYLFIILMHEYLHTLGLTDEGEVRRLVYRVTVELLGEDHPAADMAMRGPIPYLEKVRREAEPKQLKGPELIPDFEGTTRSYIS
jgi:hypothetical protein